MADSDPANPRRRPKQRRSRELVDAIVEAASQVLVREGTTATTNRIAERAGVSVGSIYQYFPNKTAIFEAVAVRHFARLEARQGELAGALMAVAPAQAVPAAVRGVIEIECVDPELGGILNRLDVSAEIVALRHRFEARMASTIAVYLRMRLETGDVRAPDPELSALVLVRAMSGVVRSTLATTPALVADPQFADEVVALVEGYLRPV